MRKEFSLYKIKYLFTISLLTVFSCAYSQQIEKAQFGSLDTNIISVEEFKIQRNIKLSRNLSLDSVDAYFSIPGKGSLSKVAYYPFFDSINFKIYSDLLVPGANAIFLLTTTNNVTHKKTSF